jgi:hypothetical protein
MDALKIYVLMLLMGAIAGISYHKVAAARPRDPKRP